MDFRFGDEAAVLLNRKEFLTKHGLSFADCVVMEVAHQDKIVIIDASFTRGPWRSVLAEALVTQEKNLALLLLTADCLPVVLHDPVTQTLALVHLGRQPTEKRLLSQVIYAMQNTFQVAPENIHVFLGPGIKQESYVFDSLPEGLSDEWRPFTGILPDGKFTLDILGYNQSQMAECGVLVENIRITKTDTYQDKAYFSHRRSMQTGEPEGRGMTFVCLESRA
jgi:YfiH family protein